MIVAHGLSFMQTRVLTIHKHVSVYASKQLWRRCPAGARSQSWKHSLQTWKIPIVGSNEDLNWNLWVLHDCLFSSEHLFGWYSPLESYFCHCCFTVSSQNEHFCADIEVTCDLLEIRHSFCLRGIVGNVEKQWGWAEIRTCCTDNDDHVKKNDSSYFGKKKRKKNKFCNVA